MKLWELIFCSVLVFGFYLVKVSIFPIELWLGFFLLFSFIVVPLWVGSLIFKVIGSLDKAQVIDGVSAGKRERPDYHGFFKVYFSGLAITALVAFVAYSYLGGA